MPQGLPNLGNTCYLNSILQGLAALDTVLVYLESISSGASAGALLSCLRALAGYGGKADPNPFLDCQPSWARWEQQDAEELLHALWDSVEKETKRAKPGGCQVMRAIAVPDSHHRLLIVAKGPQNEAVDTDDHNPPYISVTSMHTSGLKDLSSGVPPKLT
ncbi:unnamed protein product [Chrysoparadoxa australica]